MAAEPGTCRSCGAEIIWVITKAGKKAPLDHVWSVVTDEDGNSYRGHVNHFATCPDREKWKR